MSAARQEITRRRDRMLAATGGVRAAAPRLDLLVRLGEPAAPRYAAAVHAVAGGVSPYLGLAAALGPGLGLHAVRAAGILPGEEPARTVGAMAEAYVDRLHALPEGPPAALIGWSMGGLIAWEMARLLTERDGTTVPVLLLDTYPGELMDADSYRRDPAAALRADLRGSGTDIAPGPDFDRLLALFTRHLGAITEYRPPPGPAPLVLVTAADGAPGELRRFWAGRAHGPMCHWTAPGDHYALLRGDTLARVAESAAAVAAGRAVGATGGEVPR